MSHRSSRSFIVQRTVYNCQILHPYDHCYIQYGVDISLSFTGPLRVRRECVTYQRESPNGSWVWPALTFPRVHWSQSTRNLFNSNCDYTVISIVSQPSTSAAGSSVSQAAACVSRVASALSLGRGVQGENSAHGSGHREIVHTVRRHSYPRSHALSVSFFHI